MKNVLDEWHAVQRRLHASRKKLFLFDFDGTLAPIVKHPKRAKIGSDLKRLLQQLAKEKNVEVGVVSGRALGDLKSRVSMNNVLLSGNHGVEARGKNFVFNHPQSKAIRMRLRNVFGDTRLRSVKINGLFKENKGLSGSIHFRNVNIHDWKKVCDFIHQIKPLCEKQGFFLREGKKVFEIVPNLNWNKGRFVQWLEKKMGRPLIIFTGDDQTDEDAFRVINRRGVSIRVGYLAKSHASFYLGSQKKVPLLLKRIIAECR